MINRLKVVSRNYNVPVDIHYAFTFEVWSELRGNCRTKFFFFYFYINLKTKIILSIK